MDSIGLYLHIPFCITKCNYCDFYTLKYSKDFLYRYVDALIYNILFWKNILNKNNITKIDTIYFGGGTPSLLDEKSLFNIMECIFKNFDVSVDCEITLESNPENITFDYAKALYKNSINRVSVGVQSLNHKSLIDMGRTHRVSEVELCIKNLHNANIKNINLDFIIGMGNENKESILQNVDFLKRMNVSHTSIYMLKIEEKTNFFKNKDKYSFLNDDSLSELYKFLINILFENGFFQYEISNFSKSIKTQSKHNKKYWYLKNFLGIGPSSYSLINKDRFFYKKEFINFLENKDVFSLIKYEEKIDKNDYIIFGLRLNEGVDFDYIKTTVFSYEEKVDKLLKANLCEIKNNRLILTTDGFLISNSIINFLIN